MSTRLRVAAILVHDSRVLLVSTKRGRPGYLVPPGGGVADGESLTAAVAREVREEAGLAVTPGPLLAYRELQTPRGSTLELYFAAALAPGAVPEPTEGRTVSWLRLANLTMTPHYPEQLADLCARAADSAAGAVYLGRADLTVFDWKEHPAGD
jgi:ADP-ribose pyrophosphatase YjhB (NUDIX family)